MDDQFCSCMNDGAVAELMLFTLYCDYTAVHEQLGQAHV